jgi:hypothetical protein
MRADCSACGQRVDVVPTGNTKYPDGVRCKIRYEYQIYKTTKYDSGVTREEADTMKAFVGACEICGRTLDNTRRLVIDHDHETGQVRGVLCSRCNIALHTYEDRTLFLAIQEYLEYWNDRYTQSSTDLH